MNVQASIEQVAGILVREDLPFETHLNGSSYCLRFGEDAVCISFDEWHLGVRISLRSDAVQFIDEDSAAAAIMFTQLNELNDRHCFVAWRFNEGTLTATHDLLGDDLQRSELLNAIYAIAGATADAAQHLCEDTGGVRWAEAQRLMEDEDEVEVEDE